MELKDFILHLDDNDPDEIIVYYNNAKYSSTTDPSIYDIIDKMVFDAEALGDLEVFIEVPSKKLFYRKAILTTQVSALSIPDAERSSLPKVRIAFNSLILAPEQLILENEFALPILKWLAFDQTIPDQRPSIDSDYGIPFGNYKLEIGLPELPDVKKRSAEMIVSLNADINLNTRLIESGKFLRDYSCYSYSIEWIDPTAFKVFEIIKDHIGKRRTIQHQETFMKEIEKAISAKSLDNFIFPTVKEQNIDDEETFQISRNMTSYRFLYYIENSIRQFLWDKLQLIYKEVANSQKWWMGCFPEEIRNHIKEKMSTQNPILDNIKIETTPLHYCSFNELGQIIEKEWQKLFKNKPLDRHPFFGHLSYLENIRNAIAHNRPLSSAEVHILFENGRSVLTMLGIEIPRTQYKNIIGKKYSL